MSESERRSPNEGAGGAGFDPGRGSGTVRPAGRPGDGDRREFLKRLVIDSLVVTGAVAGGFALRDEGLGLGGDGGGGIGTPPSGRESGSAAAAGSPPLSDSDARRMAVVKGEDPTALVREAVATLGGIGAFVARGERVLLKPNIGWDRRPKFAANTNPAVVAELARLCLEAGAGEVIVTDSPCNNPQRCFDKSGLRRALSDLDVTLFLPNERHYVEHDVGGEVLHRWPLLRAVLECDKVINIPIAKHHSSAVLSLGMKNWYGILGGGRRRGQLHQQMALSIVDLAAFVRPVLTVMDAYRILFRNGPQGGSLQDTKAPKTVLASRDPVAIDAFACGLFDRTPADVPYVPLAEQRGLGSADPDRVERIVKELS